MLHYWVYKIVDMHVHRASPLIFPATGLTVQSNIIPTGVCIKQFEIFCLLVEFSWPFQKVRTWNLVWIWKVLCKVLCWWLFGVTRAYFPNVCQNSYLLKILMFFLKTLHKSSTGFSLKSGVRKWSISPKMMFLEVNFESKIDLLGWKD